MPRTRRGVLRVIDRRPCDVPIDNPKNPSPRTRHLSIPLVTRCRMSDTISFEKYIQWRNRDIVRCSIEFSRENISPLRERRYGSLVPSFNVAIYFLFRFFELVLRALFFHFSLSSTRIFCIVLLESFLS